jgi:uncharacterized protein with GYD domain
MTEETMAKYLAKVSLNADGVRLLRKEKASGRRAAVTKFIEAAGGKVEAFYFAFGQDDVFLILELPENIVAAAVSLVNNSAGNVRATYTPLMTVEEMDRAVVRAASLPAPVRAQ